MNEITGKALCEVMLCAYKDLEKHCRVIERQTLRVAVNSAYKDTYEVVDTIEKLTNEKIAYCNAKVVIDEAMKWLYKGDELRAYHIEGVALNDIAERKNATRNAIQSRLRRQRERLYSIILEKYKGEDLLSIISDSKWLMDRYKATLKAIPKAQNQAVNGRKDNKQGNTQESK